MKLEYWSATNRYVDDNVTSVVGDGDDVLVFTADYGSHHKYLITDNTIRRYELTSSFFRVLPLRMWRVTA